MAQLIKFVLLYFNFFLPAVDQADKSEYNAYEASPFYPSVETVPIPVEDITGRYLGKE